MPESVKGYKPGRENVHAGKGEFYLLRYGKYVIAMNTTTNKTFDFVGPQHAGMIRELVSKKNVASSQKISVLPRSTVVLYLQ